MANTIQIRRGSAVDLPTLNQGEFGFCTDDGKLYVGDGTTNYHVNSFTTELKNKLDALTNYEIKTASALVTAVANIGSKKVHVFINSALTLTQNLTIPSAMCLRFGRGGSISVSTGYTLTINGPVLAGFWQIFTGAGTVAGTVQVSCIYPEWFGATGDGTTDDSSAIQKAINLVASSTNKGVVYLNSGDYKITSSLTITSSNIELRGNGVSSRIINGMTGSTALLIGATASRQFRNRVCGVSFGQATGVTPVLGNSGLKFKKCGAFEIEDVHIQDYPNGLHKGLILEDCTQSVVSNLQVQNCDNTGISITGGCIDITLTSSRSDGNGEHGIELVSSEGLYISNVTAYNNANNAWRIGSAGTCKHLFFCNCIGDTSGKQNWVVEKTSEAFLQNCWGSCQKSSAAYTWAPGFYFGGADTHHITISGGGAFANNSHGLQVFTKASNISIQNVILGSPDKGNGRSGAGYGLSIGADCSNVTLVGGIISNNASGSVDGSPTKHTSVIGYV